VVVTEPVSELDARFSDPGASAASWADVRRRIQDAELFWISTVRPDGRPHVTPLPTVWQDDVLYFCTGAEEQKGVNLARNGNCALTTGNNVWKSGLDIVIEGRAQQVTDEVHLHRLAEAWESKYHGDWHFDVANGAFQHDAGEALVFEVVPTKVLAFGSGSRIGEPKRSWPRTSTGTTRLPRQGVPGSAGRRSGSPMAVC
jgi:nitroimidazol reductase NimA-like FMN-containing flavoprotein (pyridoxamine 5'-phosphate oxidase superfamily)